MYLVKDVWHARSARAQRFVMSKGMWHSTAGLYLTRWNPARPACLDNLVLLTSDEADAHDAEMEEEEAASKAARASSEAATGVVGPGGGGSGGGEPHPGLERLREREPEFVALVEARFERVRRDFGLIEASPENVPGG